LTTFFEQHEALLRQPLTDLIDETDADYSEACDHVMQALGGGAAPRQRTPCA
jgi:hypothetical protein